MIKITSYWINLTYIIIKGRYIKYFVSSTITSWIGFKKYGKFYIALKFYIYDRSYQIILNYIISIEKVKKSNSFKYNTSKVSNDYELELNFVRDNNFKHLLLIKDTKALN